MSRQTALDNINLKSSDRWGHTQFSLNYHTPYLARVTGLAADDANLYRAACDYFSIDFLWQTNDGLIDWAKAGRVTYMGHAEYAADASDFRPPRDCPFAAPEDVYAFDAVKEYGLPDFDEQVAAYEALVEQARRAFPGQLKTMGCYNSLVSGAIAAFGWDMLLLAAADTGKMEKVLDTFFERTLFHNRAWAETSGEVFIQHDDFVWTSGPFMNPDFYRSVIIPRYAELWKPLHAAGKKVLFCSDGDFSMFAEDVAAAGADGFIFEPCMDFEMMTKKFGQSHCLVGSAVDCRDLTFGRWEKVEADIARTFDCLQDCKGAIVAVGNHLPPNIDEGVVERFLGRLVNRLGKQHLNRFE